MILSLATRLAHPCLGFSVVRPLRIEPPTGIPARLGSFVVVLVLAAGGGWFAGQSVGPIRLPDAETSHGHTGAGFIGAGSTIGEAGE